jgi:tetratricopeptide (TPR) repeat protein
LEENSADTYYNKFLNLIRLGRIDEAKIFACRAVELDSTFYRTMMLARAQNCLTDKKYDDAIIFLDLLIELGFNTHDMWRNKGKAHAMKKEFEQSLMCYEMATKINPHDYEILVERALLLESLGRNEEAIASLEKAAMVDVRNTRALQIL